MTGTTRRRRIAAGMTLIEVLIAVTLVGLLSTGLLFALRVGLNALQSVDRRVLNERRATGAQRILENQIAGFMPVVARCGWGPINPGAQFPFFQGDPMVMRYVTSYSLEEGFRGVARIVELFVVPGQDGQGVRVVMNEFPYVSPFSAGLFCKPPVPDPMTGVPLVQYPPPQAGPQSFVLADRLAFARFSYLALPPGADALRSNGIWVPKWTQMDIFPRGVRIDMAPLTIDPSRPQPIPLIGLIRTTKPPRENWEY